jgi:hypothetical protein
LNIKWKKGIKRPDKSNAIDLLVSGELPKSGPEREMYESVFEEVPTEFTEKEKENHMTKLGEVAVSSDAFVRGCHQIFPVILLAETNSSSFHLLITFSVPPGLVRSILLLLVVASMILLCMGRLRT